MRHNFAMRCHCRDLRLALVTSVVACIAACGGSPHRNTSPAISPTTIVRPARDLSRAKPAVGSGGARASSASPSALAAGDPTRAGKAAASDPRVIDLDIIRIDAHSRGPGGEVELTSVAAADLFKQANQAAKAGRQKEAIALYRQLVADFADSQFAPVSLFNIAAIYDAQADLPATLATLSELVATYPASRESVEGHLYTAALQAAHHQWADAVTTLEAALARTNLTFADRIEAFARKGYVELEQHAYDRADASFAAAVVEWRKAPRIDDPYYIAMAHYYQGELLHQKFLAAPVHRGDDAIVADLDAKRVLAGQAYDRWRDCLGFKHAYWATAAGYQMSQIFEELWEAHVKAPYPARIDVATRPVYVADVHARVRVDLEKALEGHKMNVELAKAYGVDTTWSQGSERQAGVIFDRLAKDKAGSYERPQDP
jgi:TolA-binding protein